MPLPATVDLLKELGVNEQRTLLGLDHKLLLLDHTDLEVNVHRTLLEVHRTDLAVKIQHTLLVFLGVPQTCRPSPSRHLQTTRSRSRDSSSRASTTTRPFFSATQPGFSHREPSRLRYHFDSSCLPGAKVSASRGMPVVSLSPESRPLSSGVRTPEHCAISLSSPLYKWAS